MGRSAFNADQIHHAHEWMKELDLERPPFCRAREVAFGYDPPELSFENMGDAVEVKASTKLHTATLWEVPDWVTACEVARAHSTGALHALSAETWRTFLFLLERDPGTQQAIETVARLGDELATASYVLELLAEVLRKLASTPVLDALRERQARRLRRISGRPGFAGDPVPRPSDAAFLAEALPPRVKKV